MGGAVLLGGCGGAVYQPRPSPRIQVVPEGGGVTLVKNGQIQPLGFFGGGLEDAVRGNPRAEEEARTFGSKTVAASVLGILGVGTAVAGGIVVGSNEANVFNGRANDTANAVGFGLLAGGVVFALISSLVRVSANANMWNAINLYNDGIPGGGGAVPYPGGYPNGYPGYQPYPSYSSPPFAPQGYAPPPHALPVQPSPRPQPIPVAPPEPPPAPPQ